MGQISPRKLVCAVALMAALPVGASAQAFETQMSGWFANLQRSMSAFRVTTRQDSLGGEQISNAGQNAAIGIANVIVEQEAAILTRQAVGRFESMHNDQITGLCAAAETQRTVNNSAGAVTALDAELEDFERRWLERGGDRADTLIATHELRRSAFCTQSERERGLCVGSPVFGVTPAGDTDAAPFLLRRSYGSAEVDIGSVYVDTVAPFPTISASGDAVSVQELVDRADARRQMALVSLARAGLTDVLVRGVQGGVGE